MQELNEKELNDINGGGPIGDYIRSKADASYHIFKPRIPDDAIKLAGMGADD